MKLDRSGNQFTASVSSDGAAWQRSAPRRSPWPGRSSSGSRSPPTDGVGCEAKVTHVAVVNCTPSSCSSKGGAGCPSGYACFAPFTLYGATYGAGGTPLPMLSNPHTYTCTSGDNTAGLQASLNAAGDVLISASSVNPCTVIGTISFPSDKQMQCEDNATQLYTPNTSAGGPAQFMFVNSSNSGISNCTFQGANTIDPSYYPDCTGAPPNQTNCPGAFGFPIVILAPSTNIVIVDNWFKQNVSQAAIEAYGGSGTNDGNSGISDIHIVWNSFTDCSLYGATYDNVINSETSHNYAHNCRLGNENDVSAQTLNGVTLNYNYYERNLYGIVGDYGAFNSTNPFAATFFCGMDFGQCDGMVYPNNFGCTATGNVVNGGGYLVGFKNALGSGGTPANTCPSGTYVDNYCFNGCACGFDGDGTAYDTAGCIAAVPNPAPSGP